LCAPLSLCAWAENTLAGHYYLEGVTDLGSELLLKDDQRFQWMLIYGATDQQTQGRWARDGEMVTLTADEIDNNAPLFSPGPQRAWTSDDENHLQGKIQSLVEEAVMKRCPFLETTDSAMSPAMAFNSDAEKLNSQKAAEKEIPATTAKVETLRLAASQAARQAMARQLRSVRPSLLTH
jgi:hypothetical protein